MTARISSINNRPFVQSSVPKENESQELAGLLQKIVQNAGALLDCLLYTSDAADDLLCVDLGGRSLI